MESFSQQHDAVTTSCGCPGNMRPMPRKSSALVNVRCGSDAVLQAVLVPPGLRAKSDCRFRCYRPYLVERGTANPRRRSFARAP